MPYRGSIGRSKIARNIYRRTSRADESLKSFHTDQRELGRNMLLKN